VSNTPWSKTICVSTALRRADRAVGRHYDEALRPSGLTIRQFSLLSLLSRAPDDLTLGEFAEAQVIDRTSLSRALAPLVAAGLVAIEPGADRRTRMLRITDTGRERVEEIRPRWRAAQEQIIDTMGPAWIDGLMTDLADLIEQIRPDTSQELAS